METRVAVLVGVACWALVALPGAVSQTDSSASSLCATLLARGATCEFPGGSVPDGNGQPSTFAAYTFTIPASSTGSTTTPKFALKQTLYDGISTCSSSLIVDMDCKGSDDTVNTSIDFTVTGKTGSASCTDPDEPIPGLYSITQGTSPDVLVLSETGIDEPTTCTLGKAGTKSTPTASGTPTATPPSLGSGSGSGSSGSGSGSGSNPLGSGSGSGSGSNLGSGSGSGSGSNLGSGSGSSSSGSGKAPSGAAMSSSGSLIMLLLAAVACGLQVFL